MTVYIVTHGTTVHEFIDQAQALDYIRANPEATLSTEERAVPETSIEEFISQCYKNASWQLFLDLVESEGVSPYLLTHSDPHVYTASWNLYNMVLRLKNHDVYQPPLIPEFRSFTFLLNNVIYALDTPKIETLLSIVKRCNIVILNQAELISNLKALSLLASNYEY